MTWKAYISYYQKKSYPGNTYALIKILVLFFAKQEKLAQQAVEIGKECMTLASMDEYNKIQEGVYRFYLQNAYALIDLAACLYEDSTELDAMWNEFKSLVAKGQLDAQKFINDMSSTDANYEIYAGLQILLYFLLHRSSRQLCCSR